VDPCGSETLLKYLLGRVVLGAPEHVGAADSLASQLVHLHHLPVRNEACTGVTSVRQIRQNWQQSVVVPYRSIVQLPYLSSKQC
jgi:hypothetical protein